ncbi:MAG: 4-phosphopantoate--beta-alanine ligase [Methanocellales archaeon]|nr:4-phosphopantoate--beta-alanine ligase [Methanocellales archaeon]MDD3420696.1 4-phosphopantoate--beta-alanine ligase [Methanocellales archaeon]MDD4897868.1 4-phosphopantoate--beta-alanine ligase [Methanocellales archaeon]MDD5446434.1 4-phosphopantoate--beta-alanine ligase [Methanocellales archaeon]
MIPKDHPRYISLMIRERLVRGYESGIVCTQGLIAHGRGEAFDYLIGEKTTKAAMHATMVAVATLLMAAHPTISVNGNTAALVPDEIVRLSESIGAPLEVNLFHRTEERIDKIIAHLKAHGATNILGKKADSSIIGIKHERGKVEKKGIYGADVVLVPLEDGDRCEALVHMGKTVIAIDLNPLSRTSRTANITIVDNVVRAIPNMVNLSEELRYMNKREMKEIIDAFDNEVNLQSRIKHDN